MPVEKFRPDYALGLVSLTADVEFYKAWIPDLRLPPDKFRIFPADDNLDTALLSVSLEHLVLPDAFAKGEAKGFKTTGELVSTSRIIQLYHHQHPLSTIYVYSTPLNPDRSKDIASLVDEGVVWRYATGAAGGRRGVRDFLQTIGYLSLNR